MVILHHIILVKLHGDPATATRYFPPCKQLVSGQDFTQDDGLLWVDTVLEVYKNLETGTAYLRTPYRSAD